MLIKCVVSCRDANGTPTFWPCRVGVTDGQYGDGVHYDQAADAALDEGHDEVGLVYDERDGPAWLFAPFDWPSTLVVDAYLQS